MSMKTYFFMIVGFCHSKVEKNICHKGKTAIYTETKLFHIES